MGKQPISYLHYKNFSSTANVMFLWSELRIGDHFLLTNKRHCVSLGCSVRYSLLTVWIVSTRYACLESTSEGTSQEPEQHKDG